MLAASRWASSFSNIYTLVAIPVGLLYHLLHLPMQEMHVRSLGKEDPLEQEMTPHSSILS